MANFIPFPGIDLELLLNALSEETPALWGRMNARQMLEHLILPLRIGRGELQVELTTPSEKLEKVKQLFLLSDLPLKRGVPAPFLKDDFYPYMFASFQQAKLELKLELDLFLEYWEQNPDAAHVHPVFGLLKRNEWYTFQSKHFSHHFSQFSCWSYEA
ncbi:hypothetical protein MASR2M44_11940 [Bacteroidota bacterium]